AGFRNEKRVVCLKSSVYGLDFASINVKRRLPLRVKVRMKRVERQPIALLVVGSRKEETRQCFFGVGHKAQAVTAAGERLVAHGVEHHLQQIRRFLRANRVKDTQAARALL